MLEITDAQIASWVTHYLWPLFRILGFFAIVPVFGAQTVSMRVRLFLAMAVTIAIAPVLPDMPDFEGVSLENFITIGQQTLIGVALGFMVLVLFQIFIIAGQAVAMQMGLGFAAMVDPANGVNITILSQWYLTLVTLIFIALDGHLIVFEVLINSFYTMPVGYNGLSPGSLQNIFTMGSWMFASGFVISLPAITALLITNLAFGIMTRSAPQLNIFALGFPITMLMGMFVIWVTLNAIYGSFSNLMFELVPRMQEMELYRG